MGRSQDNKISMSIKRLLLAAPLIIAFTLAISAYKSADADIARSQVLIKQQDQYIAQIKAERIAKLEAKRLEEEQAAKAAADKAAQEAAERARAAASAQSAANAQNSAPKRSYASTGGVERWRSLVASYFGGETDYALRIMACESGGNPNASSPTNDHGLMQINWPSHYNKVSSLNDLYDPATNIRVAKQIRDGSGWRAWTCSRKV